MHYFVFGIRVRGRGFFAGILFQVARSAHAGLVCMCPPRVHGTVNTVHSAGELVHSMIYAHYLCTYTYTAARLAYFVEYCKAAKSALLFEENAEEARLCRLDREALYFSLIQ